MKCPVDHAQLRPFKDLLRKDLPPLTPRLARLPIDPERGYPVPWFVPWINGKPEFRLGDAGKWNTAVRRKICWVCGQPLACDPKGKLMKRSQHLLSFVIGPMCAVNRISGDPPAHLDCAEWSVKGCPFLTRPHMVRREDELTDKMKQNVGGIMIERNPGVMLIWTTLTYRLVGDHAGKFVFNLGDPERLSWWREGRTATRAEILDAIASGLPLLRAMCD